MRAIAFTIVLLISEFGFADDKPLNIGSRLELFADPALIAKFTGDAKQQLHRPTPKEVVLTTGKSWEGNTCAYYSIFRDENKYRMYYRGSHADPKTRKSLHPEVTCYAESRDGVRWTKPNLELFEYEGSKQNNIVWNGIGTHCFTPFIDTNPACKPEAKYKAISRGRPRGKRGLYVFASPDGIRWRMLRNEPVITTGAFDSQNLAFWDPHRKLYVAYFRHFRNRKRDIMTATSKDFVTWSKPKFLTIPNVPQQHLYTNAILPYPRAPHLKIGFPTRYLPKTQAVEPTFMVSRDGATFHRWADPVIPRTAPRDRNGNRSNYMTWGLVQLPNDDKHYSVYATEAYYSGPDSRVRRFEYRVDGFVSLRGGEKGGEVLTKPLIFNGSKLLLNYKTNSGGLLRVEVIDRTGSVLRSAPLRGDDIRAEVKFPADALAKLAGQRVQLRIVVRNADVFSMQFAK